MPFGARSCESILRSISACRHLMKRSGNYHAAVGRRGTASAFSLSMPSLLPRLQVTTSYQNISSLFYFQSDLCPIPPPLSTHRSRLDVLSVTVVRATGLYSSSSPYVTLELSSPPMSAISAAGIGRQKRETVRPPSISCMLTDQSQSCTVATWNQQFQL